MANNNRRGTFRGTDIPNTPRSEIERTELGQNNPRSRQARGNRGSSERVRDVMTETPRTVTKDDRLIQAAKLMVECDCGAIPVVDHEGDRKPIGLITDRDIVVRVVANGDNPKDLPVSDAMTHGLFTVRESDTIDSVFQLMSDKQVRRVPVVDENGDLCGIVAQADIALRASDDRSVENTVEEISEPSSTRDMQRP
ncbi:MAG: CBS domain-containing protein [Thermoanaerobaculia bacterium]